jgi:LPXTG-motif cell wall-anchored protein
VPPTTTPTTLPAPGTLPRTGSNSDRTGALAMLALMVGAALTTFARRRRRAA